MKTAKHHLIGNRENGKTICGINFKSDSIRIAVLDNNKWYNDYGNLIDESNWQDTFCMSCLKLHEINLIEQFKQQTFLIQYELALPKSKRAMQLKKAKSKRNRIAGIKTKSITDQLIIEDKKKNSIPKSKKGIERDMKKQVNALKKIKPAKSIPKSIPKKKTNPIVTDDKCKIISKPDKPIELVDEVKSLIDLSNGPVSITAIEIDPIDNWSIGDPIEDKEIFELLIGSDWKLIRHDKQLDQWKFVNKQVVKGLPKWIDDSEYMSYKDVSELVIDGYCE